MKRVASIALIALLVVACGGSASGGGRAVATDVPTAAPASEPGRTSSPPGSGHEPSQAASGIDVCALLSDEAIAEVTGELVVSRVPGPTQGIFPDGCTWTLDTSPAVSEVIVGVISPGGRDHYDTYFAPFEAEEGNVPIEGLGDAAFRGIADSITVVQGDTMIGLQYSTFPSTPDERLQELVRVVLERLPG